MAGKKDIAANQLVDFKNNLPTSEYANTQGQSITGLEGPPVADKTVSQTVGPRGPLLLQDVAFLEEMAHFDRERIPERVVHAKGGGACGVFEVTNPDIQKYCKAAIFSKVGKKTPMVARFSTVGGESGSADTARDPRGFALKFYTEEGNWDLVGNNTPIFFIRDPVLFPSFIHTQKRNPQTHLKDANMFWDFISLREETTHQVCFLFSDRGTPDGFRHMNGYGSHTFKLINDKDEAVYCKFHLKTDQGIRNLPVEEADRLASADPDYSLRDLYNAIASNDFPSWTMYIQVMTYDQAKNFQWNPFDLTKIWPQKQFPLIKVGKMTLNENPSNYFAQIEQLSFAPSNLVPGIEPSPDKMLQGRLFAYQDTARHRLGANFHNIPINRPRCPVMHPTNRDGPYTYDDNHKGIPNYWPNSFHPLSSKSSRATTAVDSVAGDVARFDNSQEDNYSQVTAFWKNVLTEDERSRLVSNIAGHLRNAAPFIQERAIGNFTKVHPDFGSRLRAAVTGAPGKL